MLYGSNGKLLTFGKQAVPMARIPHSHAGSLHIVNNTLWTFSTGTVTTFGRDTRMFRWYDYLNYSNIMASIAAELPPPGGIEIECEYEPELDHDTWMCLIGSRVGTSGKVTRININVAGNGSASIGVSYNPSANTVSTTQILGRHIHERLLIIPVLDTYKLAELNYTHAWEVREILTDVDSGAVIKDETTYWGDNNEPGLNALTSNWSTFYRFFIGFCARVRYARGSQNVSQSSDFKGYFWGAKIYINPLGIDGDCATRALVTKIDATRYGLYYKIYKIEEVIAGIENPAVQREDYMPAIFGGVMNQDVFYITE